MKVLILNPQLNAAHQVASFLEKKGVYPLFVSQANEVLPILQIQEHQIDLLILHREIGGGEGGATLQFIDQMKQIPDLSALPLILTTSAWTLEQCALHQETSSGANAYLPFPFEAEQLWQTIQGIFGQGLPEMCAFSGASSSKLTESLSPSTNLEPQVASVVTPSPLGALTAGSSSESKEVPSSGRALEDVSMVFTRSELSPEAQSSIIFEQPEFQQDSQLESTNLQAVSSIGAPETAVQSGVTTSIPTLVQSTGEVTYAQGMSQEENNQQKTKVTLSQSSEVDSQAVHEMPYLFKKRSTDLTFAEPIGDAVVPGGVAQTPDLETFKHYLLLREQDVAILSAQLKSAQEQIAAGAKVIAEDHAQNVELLHLCQEQKKKIEELETRQAEALESREKYIGELQFQLRMKTDEIRHLEHETRKAIDETEQLKERVRIDIRKIRTREKELENRLEIMKKDSEAMISTRETTIIELKRQLDLLEFNMDLVQVQYTREKEVSTQLRERLVKASQAVRLVEGLLESQAKGMSESTTQAPSSERKEKVS